MAKGQLSDAINIIKTFIDDVQTITKSAQLAYNNSGVYNDIRPCDPGDKHENGKIDYLFIYLFHIKTQ